MTRREDIRPHLIYTGKDFREVVRAWSVNAPLVADVETFGLDPKNGKLLGVALCPTTTPAFPIYVVLQWYDFKTSTWHNNITEDLVKSLREVLTTYKLIGHNYTYDKAWLDYFLQATTQWVACTRLMWHMASAPAGPRGYGLEEAQAEVLGWPKSGKQELEAQVVARGSAIKKGGHYLADVDVMGRYACVDGSSTAMVYNALSIFFDKYDYWWMLDLMVEYSWLLRWQEECGIKVDVDRMAGVAEMLSDTANAYEARFLELAEPYIRRLERHWCEHRSVKYTNEVAKSKFLADPSKQKRFKVSSDKDRQELFYSELKLPVVTRTKQGKKPSSGVKDVKAAYLLSGRTDLGELIEAFEEFESASTILTTFARPWLKSAQNGRIHPRYNPCATVSYRLANFSGSACPSMNAPFEDEEELMSCLSCDEGNGGLHLDFLSAEPTVTTHYSQDPWLMRVFRDGKGDVYLNLARQWFPDNAELQKDYDPEVPITLEVKEKHKKPRKVSKIGQLAIQYTGTKYTVFRNLLYAGVITTMQQCADFVVKYWQLYRLVAVMNEVFIRKHAREGLLRNVVGRIIRMPFPIHKDTPNRVISSSAHDLLSFLVLKIARMCKERGINAKPVIIDCHDSTTWQAPLDQVNALEEVCYAALQELNEEVRMSVPMRIEVKRFTTLAGLKGEE